MTAAETYAARLDAVHAQRARLHGAPLPDDPWGGPVARRFRADPHRTLNTRATWDDPASRTAIAPMRGRSEMGSGKRHHGLPPACVALSSQEDPYTSCTILLGFHFLERCCTTP